ncbi:MAG: response regulator [Rubrivivax sp.]|nr:response regulator [Rubrivivax sp.]
MALLIEDEPAQALVTSAALVRAGFATAVASNGVEALRIFAERPADLIVVDLMLPDINGTEIIAHLRQDLNGARATILAYTANRDDVVLAAALRAGADDTYTKDGGIAVISAKFERLAAEFRRDSTAAARLLRLERVTVVQSVTLQQLAEAVAGIRDEMAAMRELSDHYVHARTIAKAVAAVARTASQAWKPVAAVAAAALAGWLWLRDSLPPWR